MSKLKLFLRLIIQVKISWLSEHSIIVWLNINFFRLVIDLFVPKSNYLWVWDLDRQYYLFSYQYIKLFVTLAID